MQFTLTINCDNAAFTEDVDHPERELGRILTALGDRFSRLEGDLMHTVRDSNGNTVGRYELSEEA